MVRILKMASSVEAMKIILIHFYFCELALYEKPEDRRIPDASQAANVQCRGPLSLPTRKLQRNPSKNELGKRHTRKRALFNALYTNLRNTKGNHTGKNGKNGR